MNFINILRFLSSQLPNETHIIFTFFKMKVNEHEKTDDQGYPDYFSVSLESSIPLKT